MTSAATPGTAEIRERAIIHVDMDAFFAGYGAQYRNDASVRFLLHQQILLEWLAIPAKEDSRSYFQSHRLDGVLRLTNHVFGV